jgi:hypothetical protein
MKEFSISRNEVSLNDNLLSGIRITDEMQNLSTRPRAPSKMPHETDDCLLLLLESTVVCLESICMCFSYHAIMQHKES